MEKQKTATKKVTFVASFLVHVVLMDCQKRLEDKTMITEQLANEACYKEKIINFDSTEFKKGIEKSAMSNHSINDYLIWLCDEMAINEKPIDARTIQNWMYTGSPRDFEVLDTLCKIAKIDIRSVFSTPFEKLFKDFEEMRFIKEKKLSLSDESLNWIEKRYDEIVENRHVLETVNGSDEVDDTLKKIVEVKDDMRGKLFDKYSILHGMKYACLIPLWIALVGGQNFIGVHIVLKKYVFMIVLIMSMIFLALSKFFEIDVNKHYFENYRYEDKCFIKWFMIMPFFYMLTQSITYMNKVSIYSYLFDFLYLFLFGLCILGLYVFFKKNVKSIRLKHK